MTHTVQDAEAAIARHPTDLTQLAMAADLLIEAGDPRGEDFAACLDGRMTGEELMRKYPADVSAMYVAAWAMVQCGWCGGLVWWPGWMSGNRDGYFGCSFCMARRLKAEALRLLAECGKVGQQEVGYACAEDSTIGCEAKISSDWWMTTCHTLLDSRHPAWNDRVAERIILLDAYAAANPDTRRLWAEETRAMSVQPVEVTG